MAAQLPGALGSLVKALHCCKQQKSLSHAFYLLAVLFQQRLESHPVLGNYLVPALVECGSLPDAQIVFDRLPRRNEFSWNFLLLGYINCGYPQQAFDLYHRMQEEHVQPNNYMYVALLKACARLKDVDYGACIHADLIKQGALERDLFVGNTLVDMYGKCGSLEEAGYVFDMLGVRDTVSWNALIAGYAEHGRSEEALIYCDQMQADGVLPSDVTFLCGLKACSSLGVTERGHLLCNDIVSMGLENDLFVGSTIVDMYAKCGALHDAQKIFDCLPDQNEVPWNTLIAGYTQHGSSEDALACFEKMKIGLILPDSSTYTSSLKACASIGATKRGQKTHSEITMRGLEKDLDMVTSLVDTYAKSGLIVDAQDVFNRLLTPDAVSWAALISGYVDNLLGVEALNCLKQMQQQGIYPVGDVLSCSLKACSIVGVLQTGQELHSEITRRGLERDLQLGTALVDMYVKCGSLAEALKVFALLPAHDAISWAALISGYVEQGLGDQALKCYKQMQQEGISAVVDTYACSLKGCGIVTAVETGQELHAELTKRGLEREPFVGTSLVDMYAKCGWLAEGAKVFGILPVRGAVTWNALIAAYADHKNGDEVMNILEEMQLQGECPGADAFACSAKACGIVGSLEAGLEVHCEVTKRGLEKDLFVGSTIVDMYATCGSLPEAQDLFDRLPVRDVATWNALVKAYGENHEGDMAVQCFEEMREQGAKPDAITFTCLLAACSHSSLVVKGQEYFKMMLENYQIKPRLEHCICMVDLLARSGQVCEAERFAEVMQCLASKEILRALLSACKSHGDFEIGLRCFQHLIELNQDDSAAYLLMADIYRGLGRWSDANRVEEMRIDAQAKKKPASTLIAVNKIIHEFVVGDNQSMDFSAIWGTMRSRMKGEGFIPIWF